MGKGVLYKFNATTWSKSQCTKSNATTRTDGKIRHANASTWYDNYPMEQEYTETFYCNWTQAYQVNTKAWAGTWSDNLVVGGADNFRSLIGFDKNAIESFVTKEGKIQKVQLVTKLMETSTNGSPTVHFYPHTFNSVPASWSDVAINKNYIITKTFGNKAYQWHYTTLTENHLRRHTDKFFYSGIALMPKTATEWDWAIFQGKKLFNSHLIITVLK